MKLLTIKSIPIQSTYTHSLTHANLLYKLQIHHYVTSVSLYVNVAATDKLAFIVRNNESVCALHSIYPAILVKHTNISQSKNAKPTTVNYIDR